MLPCEAERPLGMTDISSGPGTNDRLRKTAWSSIVCESRLDRLALGKFDRSNIEFELSRPRDDLASLCDMSDDCRRWRDLSVQKGICIRLFGTGVGCEEGERAVGVVGSGGCAPLRKLASV
ncbi:hypothetical protein ACKS0A_11720 [Histoplasma ohiense]